MTTSVGSSAPVTPSLTPNLLEPAPTTSGPLHRLGALLAQRSIALGRAALDLALPPLCASCRGPVSAHGTLCAPCWADIDFIAPPLCDRLGIPLPFDAGPNPVSAQALANPPDYDRARVVASYRGTMRSLVHDLKYNDALGNADLLARWMLSAGMPLLAEQPVVVPVPLFHARLRRRRFNQSALLALRIARAGGLDYGPHVLTRRRQTRSQVGLSRRQREDNVRGAFLVPPARRAAITTRPVLLVDDVITSGATIDACARALKQAGASQVLVLAAARVTDPYRLTT